MANKVCLFHALRMQAKLNYLGRLPQWSFACVRHVATRKIALRMRKALEAGDERPQRETTGVKVHGGKIMQN